MTDGDYYHPGVARLHGHGVNVAFPPGVTSVTVTFNQQRPDTNYILVVQPSVPLVGLTITKATTGFTLTITTALATAGSFDWFVIKKAE